MRNMAARTYDCRVYYYIKMLTVPIYAALISVSMMCKMDVRREDSA